MIILASNSPRRRELLKMIVPEFEIASGKDVDEVYPSSLDPEMVPEYLSGIKASAYIGDIKPGDVLVTADTVVILDGEILGKPRSREDAIDMLGKMQSRTHIVVTGLTLSFADRPAISFSQKTEVHFDSLSEKEIEYYVDNFKPYDKAGAYGIQEWIGAAAITGINGSFYNVMGLPIHALYLELKKCGISIADK